MAGELLWEPDTYGDDYKEEVRLGSSVGGYTTVGFAANPNLQVDKLYDRPGSWSASQMVAS